MNEISFEKSPTDAKALRRENIGNEPIIARKNFAISVSDGFINVTGGMN